MAKKVRQYVAIDAKSFYASVECVERHLNPMTTNLVVTEMCIRDRSSNCSESLTEGGHIIQRWEEEALSRAWARLVC